MYSLKCRIGELKKFMDQIRANGHEIIDVNDVYIYDGQWLSRIDKEIVYR